MASVTTSASAHPVRDTTWRYTGASCREVDPLRVGAFVKTQLCRFHLKGICCKGENCTYAHTEAELQPAPNLTKTKRCRTLILKGVCKNPECKYAHGREELVGTTSEVRRSRGMCKFWIKGTCTLGDRCTHAHERLEQTGKSEESSKKSLGKDTADTTSPPSSFADEEFFAPPGLEACWSAEAISLADDLGRYLLSLGEDYERWSGSSSLVAETEVAIHAASAECTDWNTLLEEKELNKKSKENEEAEEAEEEDAEEDGKQQEEEGDQESFAGHAKLFLQSLEASFTDPMVADTPAPMHVHPSSAPVVYDAPPGLSHPQDLDRPQARLSCESGRVAVLHRGDEGAPCHLAWVMQTDTHQTEASARQHEALEMQETQETSRLASIVLDAATGKTSAEEEDLSTASGAEGSWVTAPLSESEPESVSSMN